jgi:hypothetical protein
LPPEISLALFALNFPVFMFIHRQMFKDADAWKSALSWEYDPEYTAMILEGQWRSLLSSNPLATFSLTCGAVMLAEFLVLQTAFSIIG